MDAGIDLPTTQLSESIVAGQEMITLIGVRPTLIHLLSENWSYRVAVTSPGTTKSKLRACVDEYGWGLRVRLSPSGNHRQDSELDIEALGAGVCPHR